MDRLDASRIGMPASSDRPTVFAVSWTELICGDLGGPCPRCSGAISLRVAEMVEGDRLLWTVTSQCLDCGYTDEMHDRPDVFDSESIVRQTLIDQVGLTRLRADPDTNRGLRLRSLAVFRKRGATIAEAADACAALTGHGLAGTPGEMAILADQLTAQGVRVTLQPYGPARDGTV
ncbi:hypothetical protein [Dactylosporangium sp. CA-233914]|uniref:hypothetical protein n=1 Tax=Dactylosporangium sp. CA-233914 TaxID=3239934 RepID=UPI003D9456E3